ncbi:carbohydrate ABC transporter permease [Paenibacillus oryzisoli]|uniref:Sugar ABC transporter permease n=1 Tax=Paenibacillus oryzisoli TaxID=1850517 RepID=A0A198A1D5_9BACL|nr:sugar ABC transporter permease [Paenibacillus oryzisoli]OAS14831.1 sugar ABC transporter permease [Paenibacillus oryzisoli]
MSRLVWKEWLTAFLFMLPSLSGFSMYYLIPLGMGLVYSFMDSPTDGSFVGLHNYEALFQSSSFLKASQNTLLFTGLSVPLLILLSLLLALVLNQPIWMKQALQTAFVLPLVVPSASILMIWSILFDWNGSVNAWLSHFHLARVDWMKSEWSMSVVILVFIWKNIGYNMILFLAGLQSIPKDYYETAAMEGAGRFRQFTHITVIYLTPTLFLVLFMSIINSFRVFRETYLIAGDYPHDRIYMLQHYMNNMFQLLDMQKLTAAATVMAGSILVLVSIMLAVERRFRNFME